MGLETTVKGGERWISGDMRWKTVPQTSGHNRTLSPTVDSRVRQTARDIDEAERNRCMD